MGRYATLKNTPIDIYLPSDYLDNGWSISLGIANHDSCNEGSIKSNGISTVAGEGYKLTYTVTNYKSGLVYAVFGGVQGNSITANGTYSQTVVALDSSGLSFWSDGNLSISNVILSSGQESGITLAFDQRNLQFSTYYSFVPELMNKFLDSLYTFKNGELWEHDVNETRNSFYGEAYPSIITFYVNSNPTVVKSFSSIRVNSNKPWAITDIEIRPREGKSKGQRSRIKKGNFKNLQGQWFADFLRDMSDPRFDTELKALLNGAELQGEVAKITMEINETSEVRLLSVDTLTSPQQYTY